ncbi:hypothetical protein U9M48_001977 [Paspalum notatum var. saurae]|uniref:PGG domain-containing protein n=1 Tax=Paspalum notatum var. saurae TaxID=547442 RepID=A0AAQ3PPV3_PASNO
MDRELYRAATQGDVAVLEEALVDRLDEPRILHFSRTPQGNTALHLAALHGHAELAAEVLYKDNKLLSGMLEVAELFIVRAKAWPEDSKSPLIIINKAGDTALHEAVRNRRSAVAAALLDADPTRGYDLNERMESPLHMAAREGLIQIVQKIIKHSWVEDRYPAATSISGTPLHQAVLGSHLGIVEILLKKRPELTLRTDSYNNNALHYAAQKNHKRVVEALLNKQTELAYMLNDSRQSPLHVAANYDSTDAIKVLLRHCPDVAEMVDGAGRNAFHVSVDRGKTNALRCLLRVSCSALLLLNDRRVDPCVQNRDDNLIDKDFDNLVDAYFLAATLIATVTFAATFTMPGGYDQTNGIALHGRSSAFKIFVVSNTVAMCSSIVIFLLIWARQEPVKLRLHNLMWSQTLTILACLAMLFSLMTAVYVTVAPSAPWPAYAVIAIAISSPAIFFFISWMGR